jgi:hypothetical protein
MRYLFVTIYILIYTIWAFSFVPIDNFYRWGTYVFLSPLPTLPIFVFILHKVEEFEKRCKWKTFFSAILLHYLATLGLTILMLSSTRDRELTAMMFMEFRGSFCLIIVWYVLGQIAIWIRISIVMKYAQ